MIVIEVNASHTWLRASIIPQNRQSETDTIPERPPRGARQCRVSNQFNFVIELENLVPLRRRKNMEIPPPRPNAVTCWRSDSKSAGPRQPLFRFQAVRNADERGW